jgi:hypothetical protein
MKNFITLIKARLAAIPAERFVTFITPIVTPLIGILSVWLVKHFPGVPYFGQTQLLVAFGLGAAAAWGALQHWLKGSREHQDRIEKARIDASGGRVDPALAASYDVHPDDAVPDVDDLNSANAKEREAALTRKHEGGKGD